MKKSENLIAFLMLSFLFSQLLLSTAILLRLNTLEKNTVEVLDALRPDIEAFEPEKDVVARDVSEDDDPWLGAPDAGVTIIEFSDFACPYCAQAASTLERVLSRHEGEIHLVFRDFPLEQLDPHAFTAALAAECADEQGKFWEMHDLLFQNQNALSEQDLLSYGHELGLDEDNFVSCLNSPEMAAEIRADKAQGTAYGVVGTPTFFVNGRMLVGNQPLSVWEDYIEAALP